MEEGSETRRGGPQEAYAEAFRITVEILFEADLVGINFETNADEYQPEARTILPRLSGCRSAEHIAEVVRSEFERWFGLNCVGTAERRLAAARRIWDEVIPLLRGGEVRSLP